MSDAEWLSRWEETHLPAAPREDAEVANMTLTDYANMLEELEGK